MTQKDKILNVLNSGASLTSMDGFKMGIVRLTNRVNELRASGTPIKDKWSVSGKGKKFKTYYLDLPNF